MTTSLSRLVALVVLSTLFSSTTADAGKDNKNPKRKAAVIAESGIQAGQAELSKSDDETVQLPPKKKALKKFKETQVNNDDDNNYVSNEELDEIDGITIETSEPQKKRRAIQKIQNTQSSTSNKVADTDDTKVAGTTDLTGDEFGKNVEKMRQEMSKILADLGEARELAKSQNPQQSSEPTSRLSKFAKELEDELFASNGSSSTTTSTAANPPRDMANASTSLRDPANQPQNARPVVDITHDDDDNSEAPEFPKFPSSSATAAEKESVRILAKKRFDAKRKAQQKAAEKETSKKAKIIQSSATASTADRPAVTNDDDDNDDVLDLTTPTPRRSITRPAFPAAKANVDSDDEYRNLTLAELNDKIHETYNLIDAAHNDYQKNPLKKTLSKLTYQKFKLLLSEANPNHNALWESAKKISMFTVREKAYLLICESVLKTPAKNC